jgi:methyl-CpG-binding domain protein 4
MVLDIIQFDDLPCATRRACVQRGAWHVLVGCLMLNRTTRTQARSALRKLFALVPEPGRLAAVPDDRLLEILVPCGLGNRRLVALRALTEDWLEGLPVEEIRHVGQYALDSFNIFVRQERVEERPDMDAEIRLYLKTMEHSHS